MAGESLQRGPEREEGQTCGVEDGADVPAAEAVSCSWQSAKVSVSDVLLQRRIELWGEGFGYYDLRRNGLGIDRNYEGTNHTPANRIKVPAHDNLWRFQLPLKEITENDMISEDEQNPWSKDQNNDKEE